MGNRESINDARFALKEHFESNSDWRATKAVEYSDDSRNESASNIHVVLAEDVKNVPDELISSYVELYESFYEINRADSFFEIHNEAFRRVGFWSAPESATSFLTDLIADLSRELKIKRELHAEMQEEEAAEMRRPAGTVVH